MKKAYILFSLVISFIFLITESQAQPSSCASNVSFSSVTPNSFVISWTNGSGNGRLVTVRPYGNTQYNPANGTTNFTASSVYGSGSYVGASSASNYVVYKGTGNSVTVTGLAAESRYTVEVYEYTYIGFPVYSWYYCLPSADGSRYTLAYEPTVAPSSVTASGITATSFTGSWTSGNGERRVAVVRPRYNSYYAPVDGTIYAASSIYGSGSYLGSGNYIVYNNTGSSVSVTGLSPAAEYYMIVYEYNYNSASAQTYNYDASYGYVLFSTTNNPPTLNSISNLTICQNSTSQNVNLSGIGSGGENQTLLVTAASSNTSLIPNPSVTYTSPNSTGTISFTPVSGASGTANISVTVNDQFVATNTITRVFSVTVKPLPVTPGSISGSSTVCQKQNGVSYSVPTIANATSYDWFLPSGASIASGSGTKSITLNFSASASSGYIWVRGYNSCGYGPWSGGYYITVNQAPTTANAGPNATICTNIGVLAANAPSVGSGQWSIVSGTGINIVSSTNPSSLIQFGAQGTAILEWKITNGMCTSSDQVNITYQTCPLTADFYASNTNPCTGSATITFYDNSAYTGSTTWSWNFGSGASPLSFVHTGTVCPAIVVTYTTSGSKDVNLSLNGGASTNNKSGYINVLSTPGAAGSISGTSTVCQDVVGVNYSVGAISNATSYVWTLPSGAILNTGIGTAAITVNYLPTASSGGITVKGTNVCGIGATSPTLSVTVNPIPVAAGAITGTTTVCQGQTLNYSVPVMTGVTYNWSIPPGAAFVGSSNSNSISVNYPTGSSSGDIRVYGSNSCGSGDSSKVLITVNPLPDAAGSIVGSLTAEACVQDKDLSYFIPAVTNATGYDWTLPTGASIILGVNTNSVVVNFSTSASSGNITAAGKNACGNGTASSFSVTYTPVQTASICYVTVDTSSAYNQIIWQKPVSAIIDSFRVYREVGSSFTRIKSVPYDAYSVVIDSTATPNTTYHKYKISAVDSCGNESALSGYHQTILFQANKGAANGEINMNWSAYVGSTFNYYFIMRDTTGTGIFAKYDSVSSSTTLYTVPATEVNKYPNSRYAIAVEFSSSCFASFKTTAASINTTRSNIKDKQSIVIGSSIEDDKLSQVKVYPNPNTGNFYIDFATSNKSNIIVYDVQGKVVYTNNVKPDNVGGKYVKQIMIDNLSKGFYTISIEIEGNRLIKKLIVD